MLGNQSRGRGSVGRAAVGTRRAREGPADSVE